nr:putative disease resistance protein RGA1 [Ziziphus jujuba var. spinosa]
MTESSLYSIRERCIDSFLYLTTTQDASLYGAEKEIDNIGHTIQNIQAVLADAEEKHVHDVAIRSWLNELEDVVYNADELLDQVIAQNTMLNTTTTKQVQHQFGGPHEYPQVVTKVMYSDLPGEVIIGRDYEKYHTRNILFDTHVEEDVSVMAIVGTGGLGKTVLAQLVFNDALVNQHFDSTIWVHVSKDFTRVAERDEDGTVTKCKIPSLMQDVAVLVAGTRLATLKEYDEYKIDNKTTLTQLVSLSFRFVMENSNFLGIEVVPNSIGRLKHLKFLDIFENVAIKSLPNSITMLPYLMMLKLSLCFGLQALPRNIKQLVNLKHLEIDWCYSLTHMPSGLGELPQLQTLSEFVLNKGINSSSLNELRRLDNLRGELKVKNLGNGIDCQAAILEEKKHLRSLTLVWDFDVNAETAEKQLECLKPHTNLKELALVSYMGIRVLVLDEMTELKCISSKSTNESTEVLPCLEELRLTELPNLEGWWGDIDNGDGSSSILRTTTSFPSFPRLSKLIIEDCPKLSSMPLYSNLEEMASVG